ncbi:DNA polymerase III subunit beta [Chelatococcus sp. XZ-Ab1]|uniref:DNA polymerase III subunit beta n=1 Tax=Chelatococcus sp. XZ-Ab1 TaxID=3034027 RepID=UPI0023E3761F|nr:DNA polymerase III subunit beta [Chelatococcus sp. XZ-Ab1]
MKLVIDRADLLKPLAALNRIVERRTTIPIIANVLLRAEGGRLNLAATDLDISAEASVPAAIGEPGALTVPAATLNDIARKLPDGCQIELSAEADGSRLTVKAGRSRFVLQALPVDDWPDVSADDLPHQFALPAKTLQRILAHTTFAISTEETRYYLNGIHLHADGEGRLNAVATDGHRLAHLTVPLPEGAGDMPPIIVPRKTVGEIARLVADAEGDIDIAVSRAKVRFVVGGITLTSKLIDGTFPDYQRVIPTSNDRVAVLDTATVKDAVARVATITGENGRAVKMEFAPGVLTLSVSNADTGEAREEIEADFEGEPLGIGFNGKYLAEVLGIAAADTVRLALADPGSPCLIKSHESADALIVLMPMRV